MAMDRNNQEITPDHMTIAQRNKRLHETLKGMGLIVSPIPCEGFPDEIDHIVVSCQNPGSPRELVAPEFGFPLHEVEGWKGCQTPVGDGSNVIDFPTIL